MEKTLFTFATSRKADPYINSLAHCIENRNISSFHVIVISEYDYKYEEESAKWATDVVSGINSQLKLLVNGEYEFFDKDTKKIVKESLNNTNGTNIYEECLKVMNASGTSGRVITLNEIDQEIRKLIKYGNCLFDVSALKKNLLVDVVSVILSVDFTEVYAFELQKDPTFGQEDLYHNLISGQKLYRNLTLSIPVKKSVKRMRKWVLRSRTILLFTSIFALIFIPISILYKDSMILSILNVSALIASISSYLFLLVKDK